MVSQFNINNTRKLKKSCIENLAIEKLVSKSILHIRRSSDYKDFAYFCF